MDAYWCCVRKDADYEGFWQDMPVNLLPEALSTQVL